MMNHILSSPPKIHPQSGKQLAFSSSVKEGNILNFWKVKQCPERTHPVMSATVSMAASSDRSGSFILVQGWIISRDGGVCLSGQTHPEWSRCAAFVKYDSGTVSLAAHLVSSQAYLSLSFNLSSFVSLTNSIFNSTYCSLNKKQVSQPFFCISNSAR